MEIRLEVNIDLAGKNDKATAESMAKLVNTILTKEFNRMNAALGSNVIIQTVKVL